jgi:hypothetical protein
MVDKERAVKFDLLMNRPSYYKNEKIKCVYGYTLDSNLIDIPVIMTFRCLSR